MAGQWLSKILNPSFVGLALNIQTNQASMPDYVIGLHGEAYGTGSMILDHPLHHDENQRPKLMVLKSNLRNG